MAECNGDATEDRRIAFRIGIHVGDIIVDEGDVYGDGVNIAARLEAFASPGAVCFSDFVHQQIQGKVSVDVNDFGEQQFKNINRPVRVYGFGAAPTHQPSSQPILPDRPSIACFRFTT